MGIWSAIKYALNSTLGTSNFLPLDKLLMKLRNDSIVVYDTPGTYTLAIPDYVSKIKVTACAGGKGGAFGGCNQSKYGSAPEGGTGGAWIVDEVFTVTPSSSIPITVGAGGNGGSYSGSSNYPSIVYGDNGGNTVIGSLITLVGGGASGTNDGNNGGNGGNGGYLGISSSSSITNTPSSSGDATPYACGGKGGNNEIISAGSYGRACGGGGGASLGNGGYGSTGAGGNGRKGGGGGSSGRLIGAGGGSYSGGKGGDGYVRIEW